MAAVWRASDTVLNRSVAVKRLHAGLVADAELLERFRREALLVARLSHPNLVHVLDRGEDEDGPYLVLELVEGENLKSRIRRDGPLAPDVAAHICAQMARALAYAHGQGVMHRDIKAQNVLLADDGVAKLADFGIARTLDGEAERGLTRTDKLQGSADYLSPEQASGHALDAPATAPPCSPSPHLFPTPAPATAESTRRRHGGRDDGRGGGAPWPESSPSWWPPPSPRASDSW